MSSSFVPPRPDQWEGPSANFVPPSVDSWEGPSKSAAPAPVPGMERISPTGQPPTPGFHTTPGFLHSKSQEQPTAIPLPKALQPDPNAGDIVKQGYNKLANLAPTFAGENGVRRGLSDAIEGTAAAAIPFVGPEALATPTAVGKTALALGGAYLGQKGGEAAARAVGASPETERLVGDVGGVVGGGLANKAGKVTVNAVKQATAVNPRVAVTRALRPTPSNPDFAERIPETISAIKAANPGFEPAVVDGKLNLVDAAQKTANFYRDALDPWFKRAEGQAISGEPIARATESAVAQMLPTERAAVGQKLIDQAWADHGSDFTPAELQDRLELLNKRLRSYYNGSPGQQSAALGDVPEAVLKAQRDAVADTLYKALDPENNGEGPRLIQARRSDALDFLEAANKRNNAIVAEQPATPIGEFLDPLKRGVKHLLPWQVNSGLAFAEGSEGKSLPLLKRAFKGVDASEGANELGSLPQPGPKSIAAPPDTSGPVPGAGDFASVGSEFAPKIKLLPAASSQVGVSGTTVPDIVGRSARGKGGPQGLLPPPQAGQPPINVQPSGPGAIGPSGTTPLRSTEAPIPAEGVRGGRMADVVRSRTGNEAPIDVPFQPSTQKRFPAAFIKSFAEQNGLSPVQARERLMAEGWTIK